MLQRSAQTVGIVGLVRQQALSLSDTPRRNGHNHVGDVSASGAKATGLPRSSAKAWILPTSAPRAAHCFLQTPPFRAARPAMGFDVAAVDGKLVWNGAGGRHLLEDALPDPTLRPAIVTVVDRCWRPIDGGTSRHRQPVFKTCRMPEMTVRSSTRGLPGLPRGRCGLSAFQASSDSQNKLFAMTIASSNSNQAQIYNQNQ